LGKELFWGTSGGAWGVNGLVRDCLGLIAPVAASAAAPSRHSRASARRAPARRSLGEGGHWSLWEEKDEKAWVRALARRSAAWAQVSWACRSHFYLLLRERRGEVLEKDSPSVRNSRDGWRRLGENRTELWYGSSARVAKLKRGRIILLILLLGL